MSHFTAEPVPTRAQRQRDAVNALPEDAFDRGAYIDAASENTLILDGEFTVNQLKALVAAMESA